MTDTPTPPGVTVLVTDGEGFQMGVGSDFVRQAPGGFSLRASQERHARDIAWRDAFNRTCNPAVSRAMTGLLFDGTRRQLLDREGWKEHVIPHGHENEA